MPLPRNIVFYEQHFTSFYVKQNENVRRKINYVLSILRNQANIPAKFFRQIEGIDGLFEIRVEAESNIYRIFCCFDSGNLVVLFNGFQKKTQKTPTDEIKKAERIMKEYFDKKAK